MRPDFVEERDFAPGEEAALGLDCGPFEFHRIESDDHPLFETAFGLLYEEFAPACEMETKEVIRARLRRGNQALPSRGFFAKYEMVLVMRGSMPAAVRDFTVIRPAAPEHSAVVVHLSHILLLPEHRRSGLSAWMRAVPCALARRCAAATGSGLPVVLAAEMEHPDPSDPKTTIRLAAYKKAGFKKLDPAKVWFLQPDFRPVEEIEKTGIRPLPLALLLRFGAEPCPASVPGSFAREIASALYDMYGLEFHEKHLAPVWESLKSYPEGGEQVSLLDPLATGPGAGKSL